MAEVDLDQAKVGKLNEIQENFIDEILKVFKFANIMVGLLIIIMVIIDECNLAWKAGFTAHDRLISSTVILSLIGATTVQVGTIAVTIANYLFKRNAKASP